MNTDRIKNYFRENLVKKLVALVLLLAFNINVFSEVVPDPASLARATKTASGIDQLDIAAPNSKGLSYNSLLELQVSEQGLILNNNNQIIVDTAIAGAVARNRNLDNSGTANLIVTEIVGKNKTGINGYVEVAGDRADLVIANRNGININGGGFLNTDRVTLTTGKVNISDGELKSIDVGQGHIKIDKRGIDALSLSDLEFVSKTIDIDGVIKASKNTKVLISTGGQTYQYRTKEVKSKGETYSGIAVDGKSAGSMYAGKIDIISNDKGAGVNTKGDLVSVDDITITASGEITTKKAHSEKRVVYRTPKKVRIRKQVTAGEKVVVHAKKTEIDVDAEVITGYLKKSLGEEAFEVKGDIDINGKINANGKVSIDGNSKNSGEIKATDKVAVNGKTFDNTNGTVQSNSKIDLNVEKTVNRNGFILADGITKDDIKPEDLKEQKADLESTQTVQNLGNTNEFGVKIAGDLNNTKGVIKGREVTIDGKTENNSGTISGIEKTVLNSDLVSNEAGNIKGSELELNGKSINNAKGTLQGSLKDISAKKLINDNGVIATDKALNIVSDISNRNGKIYIDGDTKLAGEMIDNFAGLISARDTEINGKTFSNEKGAIESSGKVNLNSENTSNKNGVIQGVDVSSKGKSFDNTGGTIEASGKTELNSDKIENIRGKILTKKLEVNSKSFDNTKGTVLSEEKVKINSQNTNNTEGTILSNDEIGITGVLDNTKGTIKSDLVNINGKISSNESGIIKGFSELKVNGSTADNQDGRLESDGKIKIDVQKLDNRKGHVTGTDNVEVNGKVDNTEGKILSLGNEVKLKSDDATNIKGLIKGYVKTLMNVKNFKNTDGKVISDGAVELSTPDEWTYEGTVEGALHTRINAGKFTSNGKISQNSIEINANRGIILNNDLTARILQLSTQADFDNKHLVKGAEYLSVTAKNITNDNELLSDNAVYLKADNLYNRNRLEVQPDGTYKIDSGAKIKGRDVYLEVAGKVVNGVEEYTQGTYRREDGVFVDNRSVVADNPALISGTSSTTVIAKKLVNTGVIGETGTTYIETQDKVENASFGSTAKINGDKVYVNGKGGVTNIGGEIQGTNGTQVVAENGKTVNETTITSNTAKPAFSGISEITQRNAGNAPAEDTVTEAIKNVGKIESSNGLTYVEGSQGVTNVAGNIRGLTGTFIKTDNENFEDKVISLRNRQKNVVQTRTEYREAARDKFKNNITVLTEKQYKEKQKQQQQNQIAQSSKEITEKKGNKTSSPKTRLEAAQVSTKWDVVDTSDTTSGILGMGGNTVISSGKDIILESSDLRAKGGDIVLNAKNYLLMLSTVNGEFKTRTKTHTTRRWHGGKKTTTKTWTEDNEYANNVDLTTDGNILMNYHGAGERADNKGIFAQGVNYNAGGVVVGYSEGNIYEQGTKDRLNSEYTSRTRKSWAGITYGRSKDYVNDYRERYVHSQLYGDAGITFEADGKLRVEGVDVQSRGPVLFKGKQGFDFLPGTVNNYHYEEHKRSGIKGSLGFANGTVSAGVNYEKSLDRLQETSKEIVKNKVNAAGDMIIRTETGEINFMPTEGAIGGKLIFDANGNPINILDMQNERTVDRYSQKTSAGIGVSAGIPVIGAMQNLYDAGKNLFHSKHKEEYINSGSQVASAGAGTLSAIGGDFLSSGLSLNYSNNKTSSHREESVSVGSDLYVASGVEYHGSSLHTRGLNIQNDGDTIYDITGKIVKEAGVSTVKESSNSKGFGISIGQDVFNSAGQVQNVLRPNTRTVTPTIEKQTGTMTGTYYTQNSDITKGNSHYNNTGDVEIRGVNVESGSISGKSGNVTVESLQDKTDSQNRGYSINYGIGIGNHTVIKDGRPANANGIYTSNIGLGYSQGSGTQRLTNAVAAFKADSGILETEKVIQIGSVIDGGFTLNSKGYEKQDLEDVDKSRNMGINLTVTPGVTEIYRNGRLTGDSKGGFAVGTRVNFDEKDYVSRVKTTVAEITGINVNGQKADLSNVNRDINNRVEVVKDKEISPINVDLGTEYWATSYGREKFNNDVNQAKNKVERVSEIMKAVIENEDKNIGLYYRDRIDYEKTRDDLERAGLSDGFILDETIAQMMAEVAAQQNIDDLQIISLNDPNIKEVVGADAIAGRAYHVGNGKVVIVAENLQDFADAMGTIAEEGRHIYHRNNNGLEDSEDYASFYGKQFENYFNKQAKDTPLYMIGSDLRYTAGQLGNDWENDIWIVHHPGGVGHVSIYDDVSGLIYSYGEPVPYAKEVYKQNNKMRGISLGFKENDVLQVSSLAGYLKSYKSKNFDVAMYKLVLSDRDRKIVEKNLKNSTIGMKEFKCVGSNCSNSGIKTAREDGKYYLRYSEPYNVLWRNCTVYVLSQFKGTSKEKDFKAIGIRPSDLRDYAIDHYNYNRIDSEKKMINAIAQKEKNSNIAEITRKNRNSLHKITHSDKLVYYDFNGDGKRKEKNLKGLSSLEVKQYLEYMERNGSGKK